MKKTIILIGLLAGVGAMSAHAATPALPASFAEKAKPALKYKSSPSARPVTPFTCTVSVSGSINAGFGSISATCSATEASCDLATTTAASCLSSVLRTLRAQLK